MIYKPTHEEAAAVEALHAAGQIQYMEAAQELLSSHAIKVARDLLGT